MNELLALIEAGDEMEMPWGLACRLEDAGFVHPISKDAMHNLLWKIAFESGLDEYAVNAAAAAALYAAGVARTKPVPA